MTVHGSGFSLLMKFGNLKVVLNFGPEVEQKQLWTSKPHGAK
jgi:hypothetical protein